MGIAPVCDIFDLCEMDKQNFQATFWTSRSLYDNVLFYYSLFPVTIWPILCFIDAPYGMWYCQPYHGTFTTEAAFPTNTFTHDLIAGKFAGKLIIDLDIKGKLGWFFMEVTSPVIFATTILPPMYQTVMGTEPVWTTTQSVLSAMWFIHYVNRSTIYPLRAHSMSPMNILTFLSSVFFNGANAYTNGMWVAKYGSYPDSLLQKPCFWFGVAPWRVAWWLNVYHDNILFRLRRER